MLLLHQPNDPPNKKTNIFHIFWSYYSFSTCFFFSYGWIVSWNTSVHLFLSPSLPGTVCAASEALTNLHQSPWLDVENLQMSLPLFPPPVSPLLRLAPDSASWREVMRNRVTEDCLRPISSSVRTNTCQVEAMSFPLNTHTYWTKRKIRPRNIMAGCLYTAASNGSCHSVFIINADSTRKNNLCIPAHLKCSGTPWCD